MTTPKKHGFFGAPLDKDTFWNLIFWFSMSAGVALSLILYDITEFFSGLIFFSTIIFVPFFVNKNNKVRYDPKTKIFFNSENHSLEKKQPKTIVWLFFLTVLGVMSTGLFNHNKHNLPEFVISIMMSIMLFAPPMLYFIIIDCPITWLFNANVWSGQPDKSQLPYISSSNLGSNRCQSNTDDSWNRTNDMHRRNSIGKYSNDR